MCNKACQLKFKYRLVWTSFDSRICATFSAHVQYECDNTINLALILSPHHKKNQF